MRSPKFILKNRYQEKNQEREYQIHKRNLGKIQSQSSAKIVVSKEIEHMELVAQRHRFQITASKFHNDEMVIRQGETNIRFNKTMNMQFSPKNQNKQDILTKQDNVTIPLYKSLIAVANKNQESRIIEENMRLLKRMKNLPSVINIAELQESYKQHKVDLQLARKFHKLTPVVVSKPQSRYNIYTDILNDLTNNEFEHCRSFIAFPVIKDKVQGSKLLCVLHMQQLKVMNDYDLNNPKVPPKFCWEVKLKDKTLCSTIPKSYELTSNSVVDFLINKNSETIILKLWKIKNNDEIYIGQVELHPEDFEDGDVIQEYHKRLIKEKLVEKEIFKRITSVQTSLGSLRFKIIQFCSKSIHQSKHSGIPGSPRTYDERNRNERIEASKILDYDWGSSQAEENLILQLLESLKEGTTNMVLTFEMVRIEIMLRVQRKSEKAEIMSAFMDKSAPYSKNKEAKFMRRVMKKAQQSYSEIMSKLEQNESIKESYKRIYAIRKIQKKHIDEAIKESGCTIDQLMFEKRDELGLSLMTFLLIEDQFQTLVEIMNKIDYIAQHEISLKGFVEDFIRNIMHQVRRGRQLKLFSTFIKCLENYPGIGLIIYEYSSSRINFGINEGKYSHFLSAFNLNNYEHLIILGKFIKLCEKTVGEALRVDINSKIWFDNLCLEYQKAKQTIYYKVPILPKKAVLSKKSEILTLEWFRWNIFHEVVRRKRWNMFKQFLKRSFEETDTWYFQKDVNGISPFMMFLATASYEFILDFLSSEDSNLITVEHLMSCTNRYGKNIIHILVMNKDISQENLYHLLLKIFEKVGSDNQLLLCTQTWVSGYIAQNNYNKQKLPRQIEEASKGTYDKFSGDFTPLTLYLDRLVVKARRSKKIQKDSQNAINIAKLLSQYVDRSDQISLRWKYNLMCIYPGLAEQFKGWQDEFSTYYHNHAQVVRCLVQFDDPLFSDLLEVFDHISWFGPTKEYPASYAIQESNIIRLLRAGKINRFMSLIENAEFMDTFELDGQTKQELEKFVVSGELQIASYNEVPNWLTFVNCSKELLDNEKVINNRQQVLMVLKNKLNQILFRNPAILKEHVPGQQEQTFSSYLNHIRNSFSKLGLIIELPPSDSSHDELKRLSSDQQIHITINPDKIYPDREIRSMIREGKLDQLVQLVKTDVSQHYMVKTILQHCLSLHQKQLYANHPITYYNQIVKYGDKYNLILSGLLRRELFHALHNLMYICSVNNIDYHKQRSIWVKQEHQNYAQCLELDSLGLPKSWVLQLNLRQFSNMIQDVKDLIKTSELNKICHTLAVNGHYEKLRVVIDRNEDFECLLLTLKHTSLLGYYQINDINQYAIMTYCLAAKTFADKGTIWEQIKSFYHPEMFIHPKPLQDKPSGVKRSLPQLKTQYLISKWSGLHINPINKLLNDVYKLASHQHHKLKQIHQLYAIVEKNVYRQEYHSYLKRCFLIQKPQAMFSQALEPLKQDYQIVCQIIMDQIINRRQIKESCHDPQLQTVTIEILSKVWLVLGAFDKINEILHQLDLATVQKSVVAIVRSAVASFSPEKQLVELQKIQEQAINHLSTLPDSKVVQTYKYIITQANTNKRYKAQRSIFKFKIQNHVLPNLISFFKKNLTSAILPFIDTKEFLYENIKKIFQERRAELTLNQKVAMEIAFALDQNLNHSELMHFPLDQAISMHHQGEINHLEYLPRLFLNLKSIDKRIVAFLQKHINKKSHEQPHEADLTDPIPIMQGNSEFIISMAKQGVNCFMEPPIVKISHKYIKLFEAEEHFNKYQKLNLLEYLLYKGADYLLNGYFLPHLKPKNSLNDQEKRHLLLCSLQSGNLACLQMVTDDILAYKQVEIRNFLIKFLIPIAHNQNPACLLWLLRKKLRNIDPLTPQQLEEMLQPIHNFSPLMIYVINRHQSQFYKEFFHDYVQKTVFRENHQDFKHFMQKILSETYQGQDIINYAFQYSFYDIIQTLNELNLTFNINEDLLPKQRLFYGFLSNQQIDAIHKQDSMMSVQTSCLLLFKKFRQHLDAKHLAIFEQDLFMSPLINYPIQTSPKSDVQYTLIRLIKGQLFYPTFEHLIQSPQTDIITLFFILHIHQLDKILQYPISIEKFIEKNHTVKVSKVYQHVWKHKETIELINHITGHNTLDYVGKWTEKPNYEKILQFLYHYNDINTNLLFEYFLLNDSNIFLHPYQQQIHPPIHDLRFLFVMIRCISEKEEGFDQLTNIFVEKVQEFPFFLKYLKIIIVALIMISPQKFGRFLCNILSSVKELKLNPSLGFVAQILCSSELTSFTIKTVLESLSKDYTYQVLCERKPGGDMGVNIQDEKLFLEGIRNFIEEELKSTNTKIILPSDTFARIVSTSSKQTLLVHGDKLFKGFGILKVLIDLQRQCLFVTQSLAPPQKVSSFEYKIDVLPWEQAQKQTIQVLAHHLDSQSEHVSLKISIGLQKSDPSQSLSIYPSPHLSLQQIEQARLVITQLKHDKSAKHITVIVPTLHDRNHDRQNTEIEKKSALLKKRQGKPQRLSTFKKQA